MTSPLLSQQYCCGRYHKTYVGKDQAEQLCKILLIKEALLSCFDFCLQSQTLPFLYTALQKCAKPSRGEEGQSLILGKLSLLHHSDLLQGHRIALQSILSGAREDLSMVQL